NWHFEIHVGISGIRPRLANVPGHTRTAQRRPRQAYGDRIFTGNHADAHGATQPDAIFRKHCLVFIEATSDVSNKAPHISFKIVVSVVGHSADAPGVTSK